MSDTSHPYRHHANSLTPEERQLCGLLDRLGEAEQSGAPAGLEDRLFSVTSGYIAPRRLNHPKVFAFAASHRRPLAAAACLVFGGLIGLLALMNSPVGSSASSQSLALAELEAEAGFTLDALLASYVPTSSGSAASRGETSFWGTASDDLLDESAFWEVPL